MAAARALLIGCGMLPPKPRRTKTSTAAEHAASSSQLDPDASSDDVSPMPLTGLPMSTSKLRAHASEDGLYLGDADLEKIVALLLWMSQEYKSTISTDDIHHAALGTLVKCADVPTGTALSLLTTASIAKLSKVIDIMMLNKNGSSKDANTTLQFMKRAAGIRKELLTTSSDNATERVELDKETVSLCYQRLGRDLITHDLLPHQKRDKRYRLRNNFEGDTHLSTFQRSFVDHMLRKALGEKKIAVLIWQYGLPSVVDPPDFKVLDMRMLQSSLDECLSWYVTLANEIVAHQTQEGFDVQLSPSSLDEENRISMDFMDINRYLSISMTSMDIH